MRIFPDSSNLESVDTVFSGSILIVTIRSSEYDKGVQHSPNYRDHVEVSAAATELTVNHLCEILSSKSSASLREYLLFILLIILLESKFSLSID
jgi:hypothetical protein